MKQKYSFDGPIMLDRMYMLRADAEISCMYKSLHGVGFGYENWLVARRLSQVGLRELGRLQKLVECISRLDASYIHQYQSVGCKNQVSRKIVDQWETRCAKFRSAGWQKSDELSKTRDR
jgi:hypothetical protein